MSATLNVRCPDVECGGCADAIKRSLGAMAGVESVQVDVESKNVTVQYDRAQIDDGAVRARLDQAGFPPQ